MEKIRKFSALEKEKRGGHQLFESLRVNYRTGAVLTQSLLDPSLLSAVRAHRNNGQKKLKNFVISKLKFNCFFPSSN